MSKVTNKQRPWLCKFDSILSTAAPVSAYKQVTTVPGDGLMRGKRYGQLMIFSDIAANMTPPPFAIFCIDADVLTGWKDVDSMITTMEGTVLFNDTCMDLTLLLFVGVQCSALSNDLGQSNLCIYGRLLQPLDCFVCMQTIPRLAA